MSRYGLAYLHISEGGDTNFDFAALKRRFGGPYVANGGYDRERAEAALLDGRADLVAFGTPYIANPDLVERYQFGAGLNTPDRASFYGGDHRGYIDYPKLDGLTGIAG